MSMHHNIIDRRDAIAHFHELMGSSSQFHVMRLLGNAKMGKTHLVSKVFPSIAREEYGAVCELIDLRNSQQTVSDYLHIAHDLLGGDFAFPEYAAAYHQWLNRPRVEVHGLTGILSKINVFGRDAAEEARQHERQLSSKFVTDLTRLNQKTVVLLFDAVNDASEETRNWLVDTFLVQLSRLSHVRVVLSGRMIPEPSGTYATCCDSLELLPVTEERAYVEFCRSHHFDLAEQSICDIARVLKYAPGLFVDYVASTFAVQGVRNV